MIQQRQGTTVSSASLRPTAATAERIRVYEVARDAGKTNKELIDKARSLGIEVNNHMSYISADEAQRVKEAFHRDRYENREVERISATVMRRRAKAVELKPESSVAAPEVVRSTETIGSASPERLRAEREFNRISVEDSEKTKRRVAAKKESADQHVPSIEKSVAVSTTPVATTPSTTSVTDVSRPLVAPVDAKSEAIVARESTETRELEDVSEKPQRQIRYAPGFEPGGKNRAMLEERAARGKGPSSGSGAAYSDDESEGSYEDQPLSAAEAAKMMAVRSARPKVVITEVDPALRGDASRKDQFGRNKPQTRARKKKMMTGKAVKKTEITMPAEHKRVIRMTDLIAVGELARQMGVKATEVLKKLWGMGMTNVTINQNIDLDAASLLANEFGYEIADIGFREESVLKEVEDTPESLLMRAPVITVMGHVDHGKTSLLDAIRGSDVAGGEAGGITQHIGAYKIQTERGELVFLDTPGHEAFTAMRARGAQCTDIVVLVVAANDGVMPQTIEAIDHARDAKVPIVVAVNKVDLPEANLDRVRTELSERGIVSEEWGGDTMFVPVSAKMRQGIQELLERLIIQSEMLELTANPNKAAKGTVLEAQLDKARGAMCSVLVQEGTLRVGETIVVGEHTGKVRALLDDRGRQLREAGPSTPVEILGLGGVPRAGDVLNVVPDEKAARVLSEHRANENRRRDMAGSAASLTYEDLLGRIQGGELRELKVLVKADVHGSAEAVREALLKQSTKKVTINVISAGVGGIAEADVNLAKAAGAIIFGFNVRPTSKAKQLAEREGVELRAYDIIYELLDDAKNLMQGLLPKIKKESFLGKAEVRDIFSIPKVGTIAGCGVTEGKVTRNSHLRLVRDNVKIYEGKLGSLRRFKDDVREVAQGFECGIVIDGYNDVKVGDVIEAYEIQEIAATLE